MEVVNESGGDFVWVHDYHLLVLPSLLRSKFNKVGLDGWGSIVVV